LLQGNESNGNGSNPHQPDKEAYDDVVLEKFKRDKGM